MMTYKTLRMEDLSPEERDLLDRFVAETKEEESELAKEFAILKAEEQSLSVEQSKKWSFLAASAEDRIVQEVRNAMRSLGFRQADLAKVLGVSESWVSRILTSDEENFTLETIAKLACALKRRVEVRLLTDEEQITTIRVCEMAEECTRRIGKCERKDLRSYTDTQGSIAHPASRSIRQQARSETA